MAVVAGKDEDLYREIIRIDWNIPAHLYDYVVNIPLMMRAADLLVCKAGGLIITEALASGLPMLLIDVNPGQEVGNAEYVISNGTADRADTPAEIYQILDHLLRNDQSLLKERTKKTLILGLPDSAYAIAEILWRAVENDSNSHL